MRLLNHGQRNFHCQDEGGGSYGKSLTTAWAFIGHSPFGIKLIHPRWQPTTKGAKDETHAFYPPSHASTLLGGLSVTGLFIFYFTSFFPTYSTHITCFLWKSIHTNMYARKHQSKQIFYVSSLEFILFLEPPCFILATEIHPSCGCRAVRAPHRKMHSKLWHMQEIKHKAPFIDI